VTLKTFDIKWRAEKFARGFDHARSCNALRPLEIEYDGELWSVVNPNADAKAKPFKEPT
jgi:hypothetical protein